jgi:hypothetical protein
MQHSQKLLLLHVHRILHIGIVLMYTRLKELCGELLSCILLPQANLKWWVLQTVSVAEKKDWVGSTAD